MTVQGAIDGERSGRPTIPLISSGGHSLAEAEDVLAHWLDGKADRDARNQRLYEAADRGVPKAVIARAFGLSRQGVHYILSRRPHPTTSREEA